MKVPREVIYIAPAPTGRGGAASHYPEAAFGKSQERKRLCTARLTPETPRRYAELSAGIDRLLDELAQALRERARTAR